MMRFSEADYIAFDDSGQTNGKIISKSQAYPTNPAPNTGKKFG